MKEKDFLIKIKEIIASNYRKEEDKISIKDIISDKDNIMSTNLFLAQNKGVLSVTEKNIIKETDKGTIEVGNNDMDINILGKEVKLNNNNILTADDVNKLLKDNYLSLDGGFIKGNISIGKSTMFKVGNTGKLYADPYGVSFLKIGGIDSSDIANNFYYLKDNGCIALYNGEKKIVEYKDYKISNDITSKALILGNAELNTVIEGTIINPLILDNTSGIKLNYRYSYSGSIVSGQVDFVKMKDSDLVIGDLNASVIIDSNNLYKRTRNSSGLQSTSKILSMDESDNRYAKKDSNTNIIFSGDDKGIVWKDNNSNSINLISGKNNSTTNKVFIGDVNTNVYIKGKNIKFSTDNSDYSILTENNIKNIALSQIALTQFGGSIKAINSSNSYNILSVDSQKNISLGEQNANIKVLGNLSCSGTKNCIQTTKDYGDRYFYSIEDCESLLTWSNNLLTYETNKENIVIINIDPIYKQCVDLSDYIIEIYKESYGDYKIKEKTKDYFIIESNIPYFKFKFTIKAHRKGYENRYIDKVI